MKRIKRYLKIILGSFIIGITLNLFFLDKGIIPSGVLGFSILYTNRVDIILPIVLVLINVFFLAFGYLTLPIKRLKKIILPSIFIPLFVFLTKDINKLVDLSGTDMLLISVFGGALIGLGHKYIYKEKGLVTGSDILLLIGEAVVGERGYLFNYGLDVIWLIFAGLTFGVEKALYSLISIIIIEVMCFRTNVGVSDAKVFYIITKEEKKVKQYIMEELHYDLTMFDVKGGYSKNKNRVIMSVIPTKDYYKLREGIKEIDPKAFISITDSYELVNQNVAINSK